MSSTLGDALGRRILYSVETQRCFGCHTTASTTNNKFDPEHLIPGVSCEACHGPGANHEAMMKSGQRGLGIGSILNPGRLDPVDLVDFCGACHRTFMDVGLAGLTGIPNLRFQPYRLERSSCWRHDSRITCLTCHDPHQPRERPPVWYDQKCLRCDRSSARSYIPGEHSAKTCRVSSNNCISCHMPKYDMPGMHFKFTDHFIHIVRKREAYSN